MNENDYIVEIVEKFEALTDKPKNVELWARNQIERLMKQDDKEFFKDTLLILLSLHEADELNLTNKEIDFTKISEQEKLILTKTLEKELFSEFELSKKVNLSKLSPEERAIFIETLKKVIV